MLLIGKHADLQALFMQVTDQLGDPVVSVVCVHINSAVIFIEMHPLGKVPAKPRRGVRKTWIDGYSTPVEFYSPDYSLLPKDEDYRRTLYWNPNVTTNKEGKASVEFYNNGSCRNIDISAETLTKDGGLGTLSK